MLPLIHFGCFFSSLFSFLIFNLFTVHLCVMPFQSSIRVVLWPSLPTGHILQSSHSTLSVFPFALDCAIDPHHTFTRFHNRLHFTRLQNRLLVFFTGDLVGTLLLQMRILLSQTGTSPAKQEPLLLETTMLPHSVTCPP